MDKWIKIADYVMSSKFDCLDENNKWVGRNIYLNMDKTFCKGLQKVLNDKTVKNTYSTNRKVYYVC